MKEIVLQTIKHKENESYSKGFNDLTRGENFLTKERIYVYGLNKEHPVLGNVLNNVFDYKTVLNLDTFETAKDQWMTVKHLNGTRSLGVGLNRDRGIEIFLRNTGKETDEYSLYGRVHWIEIPEEFLQETLNMIPNGYKPGFQGLIK